MPDEPGQHVPSGPRWTPVGQRARSEGSLLQKPQSHAHQRLLLRGDSTKARPQALGHSCRLQVWFGAPCPSTRSDGWRTAETCPDLQGRREDCLTASHLALLMMALGARLPRYGKGQPPRGGSTGTGAGLPTPALPSPPARSRVSGRPGRGFSSPSRPR